MACPDEFTSSLWIMGLSSAGKSTLAELVVKRLRARAYPSILLDGDQVRQVFDQSLGYDPPSRRQQTQRVLKLARLAASQGIIPVIAIIHPFEDDRIACRSALPGYYDVYLECAFDVCVARDTKNVYQPALEGRTRHVVGLDIPYDPPQGTDLVLRSDRMEPDEMLEGLWEAFAPRLTAPLAAVRSA